MKKIFLLLVISTSAFAAGDHDVKHVAQGISENRLDKKCGVAVYGEKSRVGKNNWDMVIKSFGPRNEEITIQECHGNKHTEYCAEITVLDIPDGGKVCQMDRVTYGRQDESHPASAIFERFVKKTSDGGNCKESKMDKRKYLVWDCDSAAKRD
jgi:hypothetical protein